jgi:aryl-alcohol dehydrogenase-like predicted oxidoreductase
MQRRAVAGREAGAIGLGCMPISWAYGPGEGDGTRVIERALDRGATLLDTADVYGLGENERVVGRAIAGRRDDAVLATKCGLTVEDVASYRLGHDARPETVRAAIDRSLERLGTDRVDLWFLHRVDPDVPVEESVGAMAGAVAEGKALALGLSEVDVPTLERAMAVHPIAAVQSELSLWTRDAVAEVIPFCARHGIAFVAFSPLGRGFLTGALGADTTFAPGDMRGHNPRFTPEALAANQAIADAVRSVAERAAATPAQVAIAWVLGQGSHVVPIPGTRRIAYLEDNLAAADLELAPELRAELDALPQPVAPRY